MTDWLYNECDDWYEPVEQWKLKNKQVAAQICALRSLLFLTKTLISTYTNLASASFLMLPLVAKALDASCKCMQGWNFIYFLLQPYKCLSAKVTNTVKCYSLSSSYLVI